MKLQKSNPYNVYYKSATRAEQVRADSQGTERRPAFAHGGWEVAGFVGFAYLCISTANARVYLSKG